MLIIKKNKRYDISVVTQTQTSLVLTVRTRTDTYTINNMAKLLPQHIWNQKHNYNQKYNFKYNLIRKNTDVATTNAIHFFIHMNF